MGEIKGSKFIVRMSRTRVLVAAALVALSLPATGRAGTLYTVIPLTPSKSYAFGINSSGDVVGSSTDALGMERAFLYSGGSISYLPSLGGSSDQGRAINDSGAIVGLSNSRAFEYKNGAMIALSVESYGFGINNSGDAVGYARSAS